LQKHTNVTQIITNWQMRNAIVFLVCFYTVCATLCDHKRCICIKCKLKSNRDANAIFCKNTQMSPKSSQIEVKFMQLCSLSIETRYVLRGHKWCIHQEKFIKNTSNKKLSRFGAICKNTQMSSKSSQIDVWVMQLRFLSVFFTIFAMLCGH
jgi:hypothetical protein